METNFRSKEILCALALLPLAAFALPHISEKISLEKGWNAVYIESTPTNAPCEEFFRDTSVIAAAAYRSDADASTAQYDASGNEKEQAPVMLLQWNKGSNASALNSIVGGSTYLIFAQEAETIDVIGVPAAPKMTWRKVSAAETNEFFNLVGVSSASNSVSIQAYFGEGPFGLVKSNRAIYSIGGEDVNAPETINAEKGGFGRLSPIYSGKAYALTSTASGEWPGVIGVVGNAVSFGADANYASIKVRNCGTTNHVFRFSIEESATGEEVPRLARRLPRVDAINAPAWTNVDETAEAAWTVELEPDEETEQIFCIDRSAILPGRSYGAILAIEDVSGSQMRVRLPIAVADAAADTVAFPTGLWIGEISLSLVSGIDDAAPVPVAPGAELKMNVMMHVDANKKCTLLQRVAFGFDETGKPRLFGDLDAASAAVANPKRFSTVLMSVDTPAVAAGDGDEFGDGATFSWTVAPTARDNPFRHAWHPDHDGKTADYSGYLPAGDDPSLYANPVKPELWSITNRLEFTWHEGGNNAGDVHFGYNPDETTAGIVFWDVDGLIAARPVRSVGTFVLKRLFKAGELE